MESIKQLQLIGLNNYLNEFCRIYENKIFPNKILLSGKKGIGKSVLSYHFINFVLSQNEKNKYDITNYKINENNKSYILINNNVHPNFFLIKKKSEKKKIEISQIRELRNFVNKSSLNNILRIILIDDVEYLSNDASNSLLKLIEEPNSNTLFILVRDNTKKILDTIKSRCIEFNIFLDEKYVEDIVNHYFDKKIFNIIPNSFKKKFLSPLNYINFLMLCNENNITIENLNSKSFLKYIFDFKLYKTKLFNIDDLRCFIEIFLLEKYKTNKSKEYFKVRLNLLESLSNTINFNLDLESFFINFDTKLLNEE